MRTECPALNHKGLVTHYRNRYIEVNKQSLVTLFSECSNRAVIFDYSNISCFAISIDAAINRQGTWVLLN